MHKDNSKIKLFEHYGIASDACFYQHQGCQRFKKKSKVLMHKHVMRIENPSRINVLHTREGTCTYHHRYEAQTCDLLRLFLFRWSYLNRYMYTCTRGEIRKRKPLGSAPLILGSNAYINSVKLYFFSIRFDKFHRVRLSRQLKAASPWHVPSAFKNASIPFKAYTNMFKVYIWPCSYMFWGLIGSLPKYWQCQNVGKLINFGTHLLEC